MAEKRSEKEKEDVLVVNFKKPFMFEEKEYKELDLRGLEELTGKDMQNAERVLHERGITSFNAEFTSEGALLYASWAAKVPIEFFDALPLREARKVKTRVINFFLG